MSLKTFHLVFILFAIMGADLFGGWAIHEYRINGDLETLLMGVFCIVGGLGLMGYVIHFMRSMQQAHIE